MPDQTARQQARRAALDAQTKLRQRRAEQERRRSALAVTVVTALARRDALARVWEARAGAALRALTGAEGLSLREAVAWCGGDEQLTVREATRLRKVNTPSAEADATGQSDEEVTPTVPAASRDQQQPAAAHTEAEQ